MMDNWLIFQLAIDAALLAAIVLLVIRDGKAKGEIENWQSGSPLPPPSAGLNPVEIEVYIEELAKLVARAERVADRLGKGIAATGAATTSTATQALTPSKPETGSGMPDSGSILGDEPYVKAARLIRKGLVDEEVGRKVGLPPHEVSLIRKMMT
jgi:hypothetical protein